MRLSTLTFVLASALGAAVCGPVAIATPAAAQSEFSPVIIVNGMAISAYELEQRIRFLDILGTQGDLPALAEGALIDDRLREYAAKRAGITITDENVRSGMEEFASRANLTVEQFTEAIGQGGVDPETFRDFVSAGILWREAVRARFQNIVVVSDAEIDRALSVTSERGAGPRVLLSEIVIPVVAGNVAVAQRRAQDATEALQNGASFAVVARTYSAAPSRDRGGQLGWLPLTNLAPGSRQVVAQLQPGQISAAVQTPEGYAIYQMRGMDEGSPEVPQSNITVDYLTLSVPSSADAAQIAATVRSCADLYVKSRDFGGVQVSQQTRKIGSVESDYAAALSAMDENEATAVTRGGVPVVLMLCSRTAVTAQGADLAAAEAAADASAALPFAEDAPPTIKADIGIEFGPDRDGVRSEIQNQRFALLAEQYLAQLRADAVIVRP